MNTFFFFSFCYSVAAGYVCVVVAYVLLLRSFFLLDLSINNLSRTPIFYTHVYNIHIGLFDFPILYRATTAFAVPIFAHFGQKVVPFTRNWKLKETFNIRVWYVIIQWWMKISRGATFGLTHLPTQCIHTRSHPRVVYIKNDSGCSRIEKNKEVSIKFIQYNVWCCSICSTRTHLSV